MPLLDVVQDVCAVVGVERPSSIFSNINNVRTQQELLACANEVAQRLAYDFREWGLLKLPFVMTGDGTTTAYNLPANFKRLLLTADVWRSSTPVVPMRFIPDLNEWTNRRMRAWSDTRGEWTMYGGQIHLAPPLAGPKPGAPDWTNGTAYAVGVKLHDAQGDTYWQAAVAHVSGAGTFAADRSAHPTYWTSIAPIVIAAETATTLYLDRNCIALSPPATGNGSRFTADTDTFRLDERLFKLGMIWTWKASKGSPYAEDMATFGDALAMLAGPDAPAPIIIGSAPMSAAINASIALPWPVPTP
jgi:hypothetical protein